MNSNNKNIRHLRHYPLFPHVGVGALLIRDKNLLLIKRKYHPDAGYWSIPGGHLNLGERVEDAALRETEEETGFKTRINGLAGIINKIMRDDEGKIEYHYVLLNYFVEQIEEAADKEPIANDDALDAKFVPFNELKNYELTSSLIELLKNLKLYQ